MRPESAPKYDVSSVVMCIRGTGIFVQDFDRAKVSWVRDKYGSISEEYWDDVIAQKSASP
jgi:hypothetical protein